MRRLLPHNLILVVSILGFLALMALAYVVDLRNSGTARTYEFTMKRSGTYNEAEWAVTGAYPVSTYDIDIGELKAVNQFSSKIKLSNLHFLRGDNNQPDNTDRQIRDLRLRFYFASTSEDTSNKFVVDNVVPNIVDVPIMTSALDLEKRPPKDFIWTASENSAAFYPFDRYSLSLLTEEELDTPGAVTNTPPELLKVRLTNPRFTATDFVRSSQGGLPIGFVILKRPWLLRILAVCLLVVALVFVSYLFTLKTPKDFLPGTLGYVAGVWGMRNIIATDAPMFPTIIDYVSMILLGIVAILVITKLFFSRQPASS